MTQAELIDFMSKRGAMPMAFLAADSEYAHPTENWFYGSFASALKTLFFQLNLTLWKAEENDCDDFARLAAAFAQSLHARTKSKRPGTALAVGEFWYDRSSPDGPQAHAVNCAIVYDGDYKLLFLEPQTQKRITLSQQEIASCSAYRF